MSPSALLGQPPISYNDKLVYKGLLVVSPLANKALGKLHHVPHQSRAPSMIIGSSFAIALALIITCARLWIRAFRKRAFGADDVVIIPACIGCVVYLALDIASESAGCLGEHIYNCTYEKFGNFYVVSVKPLHLLFQVAEAIAAGTRQLSRLLLHSFSSKDLDRPSESKNDRDDLQTLADCALDILGSAHMSHAHMCIPQHLPLLARRSSILAAGHWQSSRSPNDQMS